MNTKIFKIYILLLGMVLALFACQPEEYNLGKVLSKADLKYTITQNPDDPNMVILESTTPGVTPLWITPMGRSIRVKDTLRFPFAGEYQFIYGVESAGGLVQADSYTLNITTNNFDYVNNPLWTLLTGGVGHSKTWVLDLFPKDVAPSYAKYFKGPLYFYGTNDSWESVTDGVAVGGDSWNWQADWTGNGSWLFGSETRLDYGTMTFDLIDGAHLKTNHLILGRQENGTFMLDATNHTMRTTDAYILHDASRDGVVVDWGAIKVLSLTENTMQLAVLRDPALSGEGACLLVYNYISKDYSDNWVAPATAEPEPTLPDGWQDAVSQVVSKKIVWKLSENNPLDWATLDGTLMNGWKVPSDYPDWLGTPNPSVYNKFSMTMNSSDGTVTFVKPDGTETSGNYTLDEKGIYSFDIPVPTFTIVNWASFYADAKNQLRILRIEKDATGAVTGMWLGARDAVNPQYTAFHLIPEAGSGNSNTNTGTVITFDNSKFVFGDIEGNGKLRLELYNAYGSTASNPPLDPASIVFSNSIEVKFTLSGITLKDGAAGSYTAAFGLADNDWSFQYWGGGASDITVNGDGSYTMSLSASGDFDTALVFVIDIAGLAADISDMSKVSATIDKITIY